jgi:hypothetical protein
LQDGTDVDHKASLVHKGHKLIAALDAADHVLEDSMAALLDRLQVPEAVGLGSTAARVKEIKALTMNWLRSWEALVERFTTDRRSVAFDDVQDELAKVAIGGFDAFGTQVLLAYRALALDSRTHIVAMSEATMTGGEETVEHFHASVQRRLADNADYFERLTKALWGLASIRLTVPMARVDQRNKGAELQCRLVRLARAIADASASAHGGPATDHRGGEADGWIRRAAGTAIGSGRPSHGRLITSWVRTRAGTRCSATT